jgi:ABC-type Fe3+/spermidine/putrescine transport system ATPase subunit
MQPFLTLEQIHKSLGGQTVLRDISLEMAEGEILVLLGPSGSGKTTLLRLVAGFETVDEGAIRLADEDVSRLPPERRNIGMVFQHYALFPHMTVAENIAFGLETKRASREEVRRRTAEVLELVDLPGFEGRKIPEISGGQQQRVALARALAPHPRLLLLDEPLSNLDPDLRERTRRQLRETVRRVGLTAVWVTHEQEEAFDVGDRIALLYQGELQQVGGPEELYREPRNRFVAGFLGRSSVLGGTYLEDGTVVIGDPRYLGLGAIWPVESAEELPANSSVEVIFRPEALLLVAGDPRNALTGTVEERRYTGEASFYLVSLQSGGRLLVRGEADQLQRGDRVGVVLRAGGPAPRAFRHSSGKSP